VEKLREQLSQGGEGQRQGQAARGREGEGQRQGEGARGQEGEGQRTGGGLRGREGEQQRGGEAGGGFPAVNRGDWQPAPGGADGQSYREGVRELSEVQRSLSGEPEIARDLDDLIRQMRRLDPSRFPGNPQMLERLRSEILPGLERLELQLRRRLDGQAGSARAGAAEAVPPGYGAAVAEYFRKLSQGGSTPTGAPKR
jgi:hypothetical protein